MKKQDKSKRRTALVTMYKIYLVVFLMDFFRKVITDLKRKW